MGEFLDRVGGFLKSNGEGTRIVAIDTKKNADMDARFDAMLRNDVAPKPEDIPLLELKRAYYQGLVDRYQEGIEGSGGTPPASITVAIENIDRINLFIKVAKGEPLEGNERAIAA